MTVKQLRELLEDVDDDLNVHITSIPDEVGAIKMFPADNLVVWHDHKADDTWVELRTDVEALETAEA